MGRCMPSSDLDEAEAQALRHQVAAQRRAQAAYMRHPDPRDPDWRGHWVDEDINETDTDEDNE